MLATVKTNKLVKNGAKRVIEVLVEETRELKPCFVEPNEFTELRLGELVDVEVNGKWARITGAPINGRNETQTPDIPNDPIAYDRELIDNIGENVKRIVVDLLLLFRIK